MINYDVFRWALLAVWAWPAIECVIYYWGKRRRNEPLRYPNLFAAIAVTAWGGTILSAAAMLGVSIPIRQNIWVIVNAFGSVAFVGALRLMSRCRSRNKK